MSRRSGAVLLALSLIVGSCSSRGTTATLATDAVTTSSSAQATTFDLDPATLTVPYDCGFVLAIGNDSGTVELWIRVDAERESGLAPGMSTVGRIPDGDWIGGVIFGSNLFSNWCQDVFDGSSPEPVETQRWEIVDGTLDIVSLSPGQPSGCEARLVGSGLVARTADRTTVEVGSFDLASGAWGAIPGIYGSVYPCGSTDGS